MEFFEHIGYRLSRTQDIRIDTQAGLCFDGSDPDGSHVILNSVSHPFVRGFSTGGTGDGGT